jgi:hypothetical protein
MGEQDDDRRDGEFSDPLASMGMTLACAAIAQIASVIAAALLASMVPGGYRARAWAFLAAVAWTIAGTVILILKTSKAEPRDRGLRGLRPARIAMWIASSWIWPILVRWTDHQPRA